VFPKHKKNIWEQRTDLGQEDSDLGLPFQHQNKIMEISSVNPSSFATVGWDGNLVIWNYGQCGVQVQ